MTLKQYLKRSDAATGLVRDARKILALPRRLATQARHTRMIRGYLAAHEVRKLQIGAGPTALEGWLSTDLHANSDRLVKLDATQTFPFGDGSFDYVYSEHMIEHISWPAGAAMLGECRRVLKAGGTIRVATPDLGVLLGLHVDPGAASNAAYIRWITDLALPDLRRYKAAFVINNAFRNWGHQFLYDEDLLKTALQEAGFENVQRYAVGQSDDPHLRGIESHGVNAANSEMVAFETMVFEGKAPAKRKP